MPSLIAASLLLICLVSFMWGMRRFFTKPAGKTRGMTFIKHCSTLFGILHLVALLWPDAVNFERAFIAAGLYLASLVLFWWTLHANWRKPLSAVFSPDVPLWLAQCGPYQFIRHPFYASYLLAWTAAPVASGHLWLAATTALMGIIYYKAAVSEEKKFENSPLAKDYQNYQSRTGLFMPSPLKLWGTARTMTSVMRISGSESL